MKKLCALTMLISLASVTVTGCSFFDLLSNSGEEEQSIAPVSIDGDGSKNKQTLNYSIRDLTTRSAYSISAAPTVGNPKFLVIPVYFTDSGDFINQDDMNRISEELNYAFFGTNEDTGWYSVKTYYEEESYNQCHISGEVAPWYNTNRSYNNINTKDTQNIVNAAVNDWKNKNSEKVKSYDSDGDGYLDGVIVIYGGPNYGATDLKGHPVNDNMWAYTSWTSNDQNVNNPNVKCFIWASYDFLYGDVRNVKLDTHTYIHETGHIFGLDDYYDYNNGDRRSRANRSNWSGGFSMQDYNVGGHDPYSKLLFGWSKPYVPTESCTIKIKPFESSGDVIMLTPEYTASPFDEYFLIEYYTPTGVNALDANVSYSGNYPSGCLRSGIRLWHVDSRLLELTSTTTRGNYFVDYKITTNFKNNYRYVVGPTNTTTSRNPQDNEYGSRAQELVDYRLLDLVRRKDYTGKERGAILEDSHIFRMGDTFSLELFKNSGYFQVTRTSLLSTKVTLNNGKEFNWSFKIDSITNEEATITINVPTPEIEPTQTSSNE